jgi:hypothetical protein
MFTALATIIAAMIGAVTTSEAGQMSAEEVKAAGQQALGLANIQRQDVLAQNQTDMALKQEELGINKQQFAKTFGENQRQFNTQMNQNTMGNIFKTIGDAAMKSATFKNYLLNRAGI